MNIWRGRSKPGIPATPPPPTVTWVNTRRIDRNELGKCTIIHISAPFAFPTVPVCPEDPLWPLYNVVAVREHRSIKVQMLIRRCIFSPSRAAVTNMFFFLFTQTLQDVAKVNLNTFSSVPKGGKWTTRKWIKYIFFFSLN